MNYEKHKESNPLQKLQKIAACEKITSKKADFCSNTLFSLYFKNRVKKFNAAKPLAFSHDLLFRRAQNHYSNLTSKIMKMCEQILNIAGRLPENSHKSFVDLQYQKRQ